ncbi:hypothetical protein EJB05_00097, partial [Eragrostis curvula]
MAPVAARWLELLGYVPAVVTNRIKKFFQYFDKYLQITINEYSAESFHRSDFFKNVEAYLSDACASRGRKLKAELCMDFKKLQVNIDDNDEVTDSFEGATLWWYAGTKERGPRDMTEPPRYFRLVFDQCHRDLVVNSYLPKHVLDRGRAVILENRRRRLFTNISSNNSSKIWSHVPFEHTATFETLAMDPLKKAAIKADLEAFMESKDDYAKVGKPWKRGYLLYGPPGTGKSSMIAATANFLDYDIYDLELTTVKSNIQLRRLFIETTANKVTLSGLLNFIDGLWSACGGERIIVFTTNHLNKLDPALIRPGRMDMHIEMSYCTFEVFKILAKNYLHIEEHEHEHEHELFGEIRHLLDETKITPAVVAETLMSKKRKRESNGDCLTGLVETMNKAKQDAAVAKPKEEQEETKAKRWQRRRK